MSTLQLRNISKDFGAVRALLPISLEIRDGEFFSLLGPSGCGKTTLLRLISGLEAPTSGTIAINGADITALPPQKRNVGIVFQNYALFAHMTVFDNVAYGLEVQQRPRPEVRAKVMEVLEKVHLDHKAGTPVPSLSGGEQQRVAIARAVVVSPQVLLFDEPLSNLDYALRLETRGEIKRLQREVGITTVYVTHDQGEALALSDRIAVLNEGALKQLGTPEELYHHPANAFTAKFIGHANLFSAKMCKEYFGIGALKGTEFLAVLPEELLLSKSKGKAMGRIVDRQFSGAHLEYTIDFNGDLLKVTRPAADKRYAGEVGDFMNISIPSSIRRKVAGV